MYSYSLWHYSTNLSGDVPFFYFCKTYSTLEGAKNSAFIKKHADIDSKLANATWFIVPRHYIYERVSHIKYQLCGNDWTSKVDVELQHAFDLYRWG